MLSYATVDGGINNEEQILDAKRRIEALSPELSHRDRKTARAHNTRGLEYNDNWQFAEAVQAFQQAYQADPADIEVINNLGHAHMKNGNEGEAERFLFETLTLVPGRSVAWFDLGQLYANRGSLSASVACFANAYRFSSSKDATRRHLERLVRDGNEREREAAQHALQLRLVQRDTGGLSLSEPSAPIPLDRFASAKASSIDTKQFSADKDGRGTGSVGKRIEQRLRQEGFRDVRVRESGIVLTLIGEVSSRQEMKRDACNILSRAMNERGKDISWRAQLGQDRREIGDFACYIHCILGLSAR
jgi:tetratricopeptide (TPR) repeat protein